MACNTARILAIALSKTDSVMPVTASSTPAVCDFAQPLPYQFRGSKLARQMLRLLGWSVKFEGFPTLQGVIVVYPHTSNWDAPVMFLAKWACGVQVMFWGKDALFRVPLLGRWLRWIGGVPVQRTSAAGVVGQAVDLFAQHQAQGRYFWLGLAPEGSRQYNPGWRSGFYQTALRAQVPLCLAKLDYAKREVSVCDFIALTGHAQQDMARIDGVYSGVRGLVPANAAPVQLLDASVPREETIVR
jgi:1-acyl-sn-glycerol-3-phosphate acyltransferase